MDNLIIGIGGTGGKVIRALRDMISLTRSGDSDTNRYLCIDTMHYGYYIQEIYGQMDESSMREADLTTSNADIIQIQSAIKEAVSTNRLAVDQKEYFQLMGMDTSKLRELKNNPLAVDGKYNWLRSADLSSNLSVSDRVFQFRAGAGQYRQIGRIGAFINATDITRILTAVRNQMSSEDINVYIICSLAGGTGAGNFIDIGAIVRHVFQPGQGWAGATATISLLMLMAGAFGNADQLEGNVADMQATSYAVIREINRIQSAPIPAIPLLFNYESMQISIRDQLIFDQVILIDTGEGDMNEEKRRNTIYPKMAETVDLLTAPGTGVQVGIKLINLNAEIRMAQARHGRQGTLDQNTIDVWNKERFAPFYATFESYRFFFPKMFYQRKAAAELIIYYLEKLIGSDADSYSSQHHTIAFDFISSQTAIAEVFASMFGPDCRREDFPFVRKDFLTESTDDSDGEISSKPPDRFMSVNSAQAELFFKQDDRTIFGVLGPQTASPFQTSYDTIKLDWAKRDVTYRQTTIERINAIRDEHFSVNKLPSFANADSLKLTGNAQSSRILSHAIELKTLSFRAALKNHLVKSLDENVETLRTQVLILTGLNDLFISPMLRLLRQRNDRIEKQRSERYRAANQAQAAYNNCLKSGGATKTAAERYIDAERLLFEESRRYLSNRAIIKFMENVNKDVEQWRGALREKIAILRSDVSGSAWSGARKARDVMITQLRQWSRSDMVSLGLAGQFSDDITMRGFEQHLIGSVPDDKKNLLEDTNWVLNPDNHEISLHIRGQVIPDKTDGFVAMQEMIMARLDSFYNSWNFYRYLWEYVCDKSEDKLSQDIGVLISERLKSLRTSVEAEGNDPQIQTKYYIVTADPATNAAGDLLMGDLRERTRGTISWEPIIDDESQDEITLIRMDAGLVEEKVGKIKEAKRQYRSYISTNNSTLHLRHILPEEQNVVEREKALFKGNALGDQRLIPPYLSFIFANETLAELYLALFITGFIFLPQNVIQDRPDMKESYWLFADQNLISSILTKGTYDEYSNLRNNLRNNPGDYYGKLFKLNQEIQARDDHSAFSLRRGRPGPDMFTAMARFVQRMDNANNDNRQSRSFPFSMSDANALWGHFKVFWNKPIVRQGTEDGSPQFVYRQLNTYIDRWEKGATLAHNVTENAWDGGDEQSRYEMEELMKKLNFAIRSAPIDQAEAVEFIRQLPIFLKNYYGKVRMDKVDEEDDWDFKW